MRDDKYTPIYASNILEPKQDLLCIILEDINSVPKDKDGAVISKAKGKHPEGMVAIGDKPYEDYFRVHTQDENKVK